MNFVENYLLKYYEKECLDFDKKFGKSSVYLWGDIIVENSFHKEFVMQELNYLLKYLKEREKQTNK